MAWPVQTQKLIINPSQWAIPCLQWSDRVQSSACSLTKTKSPESVLWSVMKLIIREMFKLKCPHRNVRAVVVNPMAASPAARQCVGWGKACGASSSSPELTGTWTRFGSRSASSAQKSKSKITNSSEFKPGVEKKCWFHKGMLIFQKSMLPCV